MSARLYVVLATSALAFIGVLTPAAKSQQVDGPVIVVAASYPGATAQVVAETIAAPIEQQINGVEGMIRVESKSDNDGKYVAHLYFKPRTDLEIATTLVQNRVALAMPLLPDNVTREGLSVKREKVKTEPNQVAIAVIDRQDRRWDALEKAAVAVLKRLETEGAIIKPVAFPQQGKQVAIEIDRAKCAALGVLVEDALTAIQAAGSDKKIDDLKKVVVRASKLERPKVPLLAIAAIREEIGPLAVYRINLHPAIRIAGAPADGKSAAGSALRCLKLAQDELQRTHSDGFEAETVSPRGSR